MKPYFYFLVALAIFITGCKQESETLFRRVTDSGIKFRNDVKHTADFNIFSYRNFYNGGGAAIGDINNDGLADVFFTANMGANKLFLNKGGFKFQDVSAAAGFVQKEDWSTGVTMVDINADGWLDIYVCNAGYINGKTPRSQLFINNKNLTFTESAESYGLSNTGGYATHAAFFDYDLDGDLDAFIINNSFIPVNTLNYSNRRNLRAKDWPVADFLKGGGDRFLRNDGGKFVEASEAAGVYGSLLSFGLGVTVGDVNGDLYPDVYVSNDFFERDYLYVNQQNGTFKEDLENWLQHSSLASMGADIGDLNGDGYPDIFTTDMMPDDDYRLKTTSLFDNIDIYNLKEKQGFYHQFMQNTLQVNNRQGKFMDVAHFSGVAASDWSWGGLIFDADNDGLSDIYVCNGIYHDVTDQDFIDYFANDVIQKMVMSGRKEEVDKIIDKMPSNPIPNKAFRNQGGLKFSDQGADWGLAEPSFSNGAAYGDLDNDGDLDLVVNNVNQDAFIYQNTADSASAAFLAISLKGAGQNSFAVGASLKAYSGGTAISREMIPSRGFQSSVDYRVIMGLGTRVVDSLVVVWPDRSRTKIDRPRKNEHLVLDQRDARPYVAGDTGSLAIQPFLESLPHPFVQHKEDDYIDFYYERGLPAMLSREGPGGASGDVDGDGLADVYIGGTAVQPGQLYLQRKGGFRPSPQKAFGVGGFEDAAALFFDADGDKDLDLFLGSGGNRYPANSFQLQNRLYKNDGKGNFTPAPPLPQSGMNTAVIAAHDFDRDGDQDLFVGSRSFPQSYGSSPKSQLLVNDGAGNFLDASGLFEDGGLLGMLTGAVWADIAGDGREELVIVGEWVAPRIFSYNGKAFVEVATNLSALKGLWQTVAAEDLDGDGKKDLVLGNIGENFYLHPGKQTPVKLWISDFDNNGTVEKVLSRTVTGKDVPVFLKKELTDQVASLKKQNLRYEEFARKSIQELFEAEALKKAGVLEFDYCSSVVAYNTGGGQFELQKLPLEVQFSSLNKVLVEDLNKDGRQDLVMGGNSFNFQPQFSRLDASFGHVALNDGRRGFRLATSRESGLHLPGELRNILQLPGREGTQLLFLQNNRLPQLYRINSVAK